MERRILYNDRVSMERRGKRSRVPETAAADADNEASPLESHDGSSGGSTSVLVVAGKPEDDSVSSLPNAEAVSSKQSSSEEEDPPGVVERSEKLSDSHHDVGHPPSEREELFEETDDDGDHRNTTNISSRKQNAPDSPLDPSSSSEQSATPINNTSEAQQQLSTKDQRGQQIPANFTGAAEPSRIVANPKSENEEQQDDDGSQASSSSSSPPSDSLSSSRLPSPFLKTGDALEQALDDFRETVKSDAESSSNSYGDEADISSSSYSVGMLTETVSPLNPVSSVAEDEVEVELNSRMAVAPLSPQTSEATTQQETELTRAVKNNHNPRRAGSQISSEDGASQISSLYGLNRPILREIFAPEDKFWNRPVSFRHPRTVLRKVRLFAGKIVLHPRVQLSIVWLIVINAILMGIATFDFVTDYPHTEKAFETADLVFLCIFTAEVTLQLLYLGVSLFFDGWLVFDLIVVLASWSLESMQVVRAFRVFRAFRLITRLGPLRELILSIGAVLPRMYAIFVLLLLVFYIYAVLFTTLFGDLPLSEDYFGSLDASLFTCMQMMTLEWADVAREVMDAKSWAWIVFLSFISITGFIVFNLIVAVVCDAVAVTESQCKAERLGPDDSDQAKLKHAEKRIRELSAQVKIMRGHHIKLQQTVGVLTGELQRSLLLIQQQQPDHVDFNASANSFFDHGEMIIGNGSFEDDLGESTTLLNEILSHSSSTMVIRNNSSLSHGSRTSGRQNSQLSSSTDRIFFE